MAESASNTTIIGTDTHIKGEMSFENNCQLLGRFEGTIRAEGDLHIADGATCRAEVHTTNITVDGVVEGNVTVTDKVQLNAKSRMTGDLVAAKLIVAEGATFDGHVSVGSDAVKATQGGSASQTSSASQNSSTSQPTGKPQSASPPSPATAKSQNTAQTVGAK